jgi:hypothetical protein
MKKIFKTLFLTMFLFCGCVKECHLRYEPEKGNISIEPLNLNTEISVDVKKLEGIQGSITGGLIGYSFPEIEKDIKEAVEKDLRKTLFPIVNEDVPNIYIYVEVSLRTRQQIHAGRSFIAYIPMVLGAMIGLYWTSNLPEEQAVAGFAVGIGSITLGVGVSGCLFLTIPTQESIAEVEIECAIKGNNKKLMKTYESKKKVKKSVGTPFSRKYEIHGSESVVILSLRDALNIIKLRINEDRNEILKLAEEYQEEGGVISE